MIILDDQNFDQEVQNSDLPVLVDFFADWCGPCQMQGPIIEELAKELDGKVKVVKVNVDQSPQTSQKQSVMSIPTLVLFKNGQEIKRMTGFQSKEDLLKEIT